MKKETEQVYEHPSYGMVSLNRITVGGKNRLFGSPLRHHYAAVVLRIQRAKRVEDELMDRVSATDEIIRVELSEAQFASMLTNMNVGDGVPCTIRHIQYERIEEPPDVELEPERIETWYNEYLSDLIQDSANARAEIRSLLDKKSLTKADKEAILSKFSAISRMLSESLPFLVGRFNEASEKIKAAARSEIDAFLSNVLRATGIKGLQEGVLPSLLEGPAEKEPKK